MPDCAGIYEAVTCAACDGVHLVAPATWPVLACRAPFARVRIGAGVGAGAGERP